MTECKYFALFTEKPQYLDVSRIFVTTYTHDVYNSSQ